MWLPHPFHLRQHVVPMLLSHKRFVILLRRFDVLIPELGRSIACLLTGTPIKEKIKKVGDGLRIDIQKKSLRYNKSVNIGKATAAA
jgi:hypothetical protein